MRSPQPSRRFTSAVWPAISPREKQACVTWLRLISANISAPRFARLITKARCRDLLVSFRAPFVDRIAGHLMTAKELRTLSTGEWISRGAEETFNLGVQIGNQLGGGEILLLRGPLGAGKTIFVKGLA